MGDRKHEQARADANAKQAPSKSGAKRTPHGSDGEVRPKPVQDDAALTLARTSLTFSAVVGRPTLSEEIAIQNLTPQTVDAHIRIEDDDAKAFVLESETAEAIPAASEQPAGKSVNIKYAPARAGTHSATVVILTQFGEHRATLHGTASELPGAAPLVTDGTPEPVRSLSEEADSAPAKKFSHAVDAVSALANNFETTRGGMDQVARAYASEIINAGNALTAKVLAWLKDEGLTETKANNEHELGAGGVLQAFFMKGLEKNIEEIFKVGGPQLAAIMFAIELGSTVHETIAANGEADERVARYQEHMSQVFDAAAGLGPASAELMRRYGGLAAGYASRRADVRRVASQESMMVLEQLQAGGPSRIAETYARAAALLEDYAAAQQAWGTALSAFSVSAAKAPVAVENGFNGMLDRYLAFRAEHAREEQLPKEFAGVSRERMLEANPKLKEKLETKSLEIAGFIDLASPVNVQFASYRTGEYEELSDTMRGRVESQVVDSFEKSWLIEARFAVVQGGEVVVERAHSGRWDAHSDRDGSAALERVGAENLIEMVRSGTVAARVVKVQ